MNFKKVIRDNALNIIMQKPHKFYKKFNKLLQDHKMVHFKLRLSLCVKVCQRNHIIKFNF
jgi:hypothetical protein